MKNFLELNFPAPWCELLKRQGIVTPTVVQEQTVPAVRSGRNLIVQSRTGSGKTLAYLLPILEKIKTAPVTQALIITPTRELAMQVGKVLADLAVLVDVRSLTVCGGRDIEAQKQKLKNPPQIVVGTPGRILDHVRRRTVDLTRVNRVVLDEADEMLKRGFLEEAEQIIKVTARGRQLLLFSATIPPKVRALARHYMNKLREITLSHDLASAENIEQIRVNVQEDQKLAKLCELIDEQRPYLAMVFCRTKERTAKLALELAKRGYAADELHGDLSQTERNAVLKKFRTAKLQILVATDLAARGLDIEGITHIYNYDLPMDAEGYLHRIGRTGRAGNHGVSVTFVHSREYAKLRQIEVAVKSRLTPEINKQKNKKVRKKAKNQSKSAALPRKLGGRFSKKELMPSR